MIFRSKKVDILAKIWRTPELRVLVLSNPEENVLMACKFAGAGAGPSTSDSLCYMFDFIEQTCVLCSSYVPS